jgi:hypothetical protein
MTRWEDSNVECDRSTEADHHGGNGFGEYRFAR